MTQRSTVLTIGVALLLVGTLIGGFTLGGSATGQPTTPDDSGSESGGNTTTTDSDTDFKDPSQVADEHPSNYTDSDDVVEDSLFTPSSNNSTENASNESGRWSEGAEVKDDCSGDW